MGAEWEKEGAVEEECEVVGWRREMTERAVVGRGGGRREGVDVGSDR